MKLCWLFLAVLTAPSSTLACMVDDEVGGFGRRVSATASGAGPSFALREGVEVALMPTARIKPRVTPGRAAPAESFGGFVTLVVPRSGPVEVRLSNRTYVDVIVGGRVLVSTSHGRPGMCSTLHKAVLFDMPAGRHRLQLTGSADRVLRIWSKELPR